MSFLAKKLMRLRHAKKLNGLYLGHGLRCLNGVLYLQTEPQKVHIGFLSQLNSEQSSDSFWMVSCFRSDLLYIMNSCCLFYGQYQLIRQNKRLQAIN